MAPDARVHELMYVSDFGAASVSVYSYPAGKLEGHLRGVVAPAGECSDRSGNVFVTEPTAGKIREFAHGGTRPIAVLKDSAPVACSVDPTTGDLAVANQSSQAGPSGVSIFAAAHGAPVKYSAKGFYQHYAVAYDGAGNLFVDGVSRHLKFRLAELLKNTAAFAALTVDHQIRVPGNVQWDGTHLAIGEQGKGRIYRFAIAGGHGTLTSTVTLGDAWDPCQFWIAGTTVIAPNFAGKSVGFWNYPDGGAPTKTIDGLDQPFGVTISALP